MSTEGGKDGCTAHSDTSSTFLTRGKKANNGMCTASGLGLNTSGPVVSHLCAQPEANFKIGFYCHMDIRNAFRER